MKLKNNIHLSLLLRKEIIYSFMHLCHLLADIPEACWRNRSLHFILQVKAQPVSPFCHLQLVYRGEFPTAIWSPWLLMTSQIKVHSAYHKSKHSLGMIWLSQAQYNLLAALALFKPVWNLRIPNFVYSSLLVWIASLCSLSFVGFYYPMNYRCKENNHQASYIQAHALCDLLPALSFRFARVNDRHAIPPLMNTPLKYLMRENYFSKITYLQISEESRKGKHKEMEASENSVFAIENPHKNRAEIPWKQSRKHPFSQWLRAKKQHNGNHQMVRDLLQREQKFLHPHPG